MNRLLSLGTLLILFVLFTHPIDTDGDFFQHVNIGKYVATHGALPRADDLTFTAAGRPYIGYAWLSGLVFYGMYQTVGAIGINVLVLSVALLTFWLLYRYLRAIGISHRITLLTILLAAPVVASRWPTRPEIFMYPIFLSFLLLDEMKRRHPRIVLLYPVLMLFLVNLYGSSFPMAAALLGILVVKNMVTKEKRLMYYASILCSIPIAFINGYGWKSIAFIVLIPKMTTLWGDWLGLVEIIRRPEIGFAWEVVVLNVFFTAFVAVLMVFSYRLLKRQPWLTALALTMFLPYWAVRLRAISAIFAAPLIGYILDRVRWRWIAPIIGIIGVGMAMFVVNFYPPGLGDFDIVPMPLIQFVKTNGLTGNVFNVPQTGSFLAYHLAPAIRIFADTRDDLFIGSGVLEAEAAFLVRKASAAHLLRKYDIDIVIIDRANGSSFRDLLYNDQWALVYFADNYLIFVPRSVAIDKNLPIFDTIDPYLPTGEKTNTVLPL